MGHLEHEVRAVMQQSAKALTVDQVSQEVAMRMKDDIRSVLHALVKNNELTSVHGGGGYSTHYHAPAIVRRF
jgi:hypothetical protein